MGQVEEERLSFVVLDKPVCLDAQPVGEIFAVGPFGQGRDLVWGEIVLRVWGFGAGEVEVEAVFVRVIRLAAQVPLADAGGGIAGGVEGVGQGELLSGRYLVQSTTSSLGFSGGRPGIQSVMCRRAGYLPVRMAAREGEQTVQAE